MCKVMRVSRNGYYSWVKRGSGIFPQEDISLNNLIREIFVSSRKSYGTIRIKKALLKLYGVIVSRRRIGRIMKRLGLQSVHFKRKRVITTDSNHSGAISENRLNQEFQTKKPNEVYVGDITYIPTSEGMVYLATVIDLFSRKIIGYSVDDNMKTQLVIKSLEMAIKRCEGVESIIFHSDRGSQYSSKEYRDMLTENKFLQSMSKKGDCFDNAVAESCFKSIKTELVYVEEFKDLADVKLKVFHYIQGFYNTKRLHSFCEYMSPNEFEEDYYRNLKVVA
jgi:putative transposase